MAGFGYSAVLVYFLHHFTLGGGGGFVDESVPETGKIWRLLLAAMIIEILALVLKVV